MGSKAKKLAVFLSADEEYISFVVTAGSNFTTTTYLDLIDSDEMEIEKVTHDEIFLFMRR